VVTVAVAPSTACTVTVSPTTSVASTPP
jgi:hypothetical protein